MYELVITPDAEKQLDKLPWRIREDIITSLRDLREYPSLGKPLGRELTGQRSLKVGVYRIVYKIFTQDKRVLITIIDHRAKVYN